mgnify:CR=1 FL=1
MASLHDRFLAAGVRIVAIDVDTPAQHAAMIAKLDLPFPYLSDPDRSGAIEPYGLSNPDDARNLAYPAIVVVDRDGTERWRWVSRDFADRLPEAEVLEAVEGLGLRSVTAAPLEVGPAAPGPKAMPLAALEPYFRGAKFAAMAMYLRLRDTEAAEQAKAESKAYGAEMDRYLESVKELRRRKEA